MNNTENVHFYRKVYSMLTHSVIQQIILFWFQHFQHHLCSLPSLWISQALSVQMTTAEGAKNEKYKNPFYPK